MSALEDARADLQQITAEIDNRIAAGRLPTRAMYEIQGRRLSRVATELANHQHDAAVSVIES